MFVANVEKHGVPFEEAAAVLAILSRVDPKSVDAEFAAAAMQHGTKIEIAMTMYATVITS